MDGAAKVKKGGSKDGVHTFDVTLPEKVGVDAAKIAQAVQGFKVEKISTELVGDAAKDEAGVWWLTRREPGLKLKVTGGAKDEGVKAIEAGVAEGKKTFKVGGELDTAKEGDKETSVIAVSTASPV